MMILKKKKITNICSDHENEGNDQKRDILRQQQKSSDTLKTILCNNKAALFVCVMFLTLDFQPECLFPGCYFMIGGRGDWGLHFKLTNYKL